MKKILVLVSLLAMTSIAYAANVKNYFANPTPGTRDNVLTVTGNMNATSVSTVTIAGIFDLNGSMTDVKYTGSMKLSYQIATDSVTVTNVSPTVIICTKNGAQSVSLPTAVGNGGLYFIIKKRGTAAVVSILTNSTETIDGADNNTSVDAQNDFLGIVSDGSNWVVVNRYIQ